MREHPIPQDVVGYRFHIIGNMTIKQFAEIGFGCLLGFIIYSTNLFPILKWPLIGLSVGIGSLAAFLPFEERPLDHWITTFFKVMYKPTQFFWRREPKIPEPFLYKPEQHVTTVNEIDLSPARRQRIKEFLRSLDKPNTDEAFLAEQARQEGILAMFTSTQVTEININQKPDKPSLVVKPRSMRAQPGAEETEVVPAAPTYAEFAVPEASTADLAQQYQYQLNQANQKTVLQVNQVAADVVIPELDTITVDTPQGYAATDQIAPPVGQPSTEATAIAPEVSHEQLVAAPQDAVPSTGVLPTQAVTHNAALPFPIKPTDPNKIVGMVLSPQNELVSEAIVEIKNEQGMVARAVKTNALGQFFISTPLPSGNYSITVDKAGLQFTPLQLSLTNSIVDPLEIRSL